MPEKLIEVMIIE